MAKFKYEVLTGSHSHIEPGKNPVTYHKGNTFETNHELVGIDQPGSPQKLKLVGASETGPTKAK